MERFVARGDIFAAEFNCSVLQSKSLQNQSELQKCLQLINKTSAETEAYEKEVENLDSQILCHSQELEGLERKLESKCFSKLNK